LDPKAKARIHGGSPHGPVRVGHGGDQGLGLSRGGETFASAPHRRQQRLSATTRASQTSPCGPPGPDHVSVGNSWATQPTKKRKTAASAQARVTATWGDHRPSASLRNCHTSLLISRLKVRVLHRPSLNTAERHSGRLFLSVWRTSGVNRARILMPIG
jgi:hypothetical protein